MKALDNTGKTSRSRVLLALIIPLLLANGPVVESESVSGPSFGAIDPSVLDAARLAANTPIAERMKAVTEPLLNAPYVADPLGEGTGRDADPFSRYDAYDCLTLVEEAMAMSLTGDPTHSAAVRNGLRYGGREPSYATRNHFMELQWIPEAIENGWLRDTTAEYGDTVLHTNDVTEGTWKAWSRRKLFKHTDEELPVGTMTLNVLPLNRAIEVADDIRPGSIVMSVRENRPWIPLWVTHLGFTIPSEQDGVMFRHASMMKASMRVRDHKLRWYLEHSGTYKNWKTAGIAVFEPIEYGPRISRLPAEQRQALTTQD